MTEHEIGRELRAKRTIPSWEARKIMMSAAADPEIARRRAHLVAERRRRFVLEVLSALSGSNL